MDDKTNSPASGHPLAQTVPFNVNHYVRVKLTTRGLELLRQEHDRYRRLFPSLGDFVAPKADSEGWTRWQLWDLMHRLGEHVYNGATVPFETEILVEVAPND